MAVEWLMPFQAVSRTAPARVLLEAAGKKTHRDSAEFLRELDALEDLEIACPWERSYEIREGDPPAGDPETLPESFGARILRERREKAAAEEEFKRTGEPALPPCGPPRALSAADYAERNEQATRLRTMREDLVAKIPAETVRLSSQVGEALGVLRPQEPPVMRCGSEAVYTGKGTEVHAAAWLRVPEMPAPAAPRRADLVLCVDTSGSMKMDMPVVRSVLTKLVRRMSPKDQLCLITFDSAAKLQLDWTECSSEGKKRLHDIVDSLEAEGRTAFAPALGKVFEQLQTAKSLPVHVFFMSDGKPDDSPYCICSKLRRELPPVGVSLSTVSFGHKSDSALLARLSHMGRGHHVFVTGMMMVGSAIGRLCSWAQYSAGECFLVVRGLGGCKVMETEECYGRVQLKDGSKATVVLLGNLMQGQRRAVALRLALPSGAKVPIKEVDMALAECTFLLRPASGENVKLQVARCKLKAVQAPSLLSDGSPGFPMRVYLQDDAYEAFNGDRRRLLERTLREALALPEGALVVDRVRKGSVAVYLRVVLPAQDALPLLKRLNLAAVETRLREEGFGLGDEGCVEVPGQLTAQRWLQWAAANDVAEKPLVNVPAVAGLAGGPLGFLDQRTAAAAGQDVWTTRRKDDHWRLQLQAAHLRAFPSDPEAHVSLRAYDTHELHQGAQALDSRNGAPVRWLTIQTGGEGGREGYTLQLEWEGELQGPHWLVTVEPEGPGSEILSCFRHFDQNGDGVISPDELSHVLQTIDPRAWTKERTDALLSVIDTNGDGLIQYNEFVSWLTAGDDSWDQLRQDIGIGRDTAQRFTRRRVKVAHSLQCGFEGLPADIYRVTVKGADMQGCPGMYGQCWACLGLPDLSPVVALLEAQEGPGGLLQFSPVSWIGWGTMGPAQAN